jgi:hypothetical protein
MKTTFTCLVLLLACGAAAAQTSPYSGEQTRPIKALGADELRTLMEGRGFGFANAAELNGYPGPMRVVELSGRLDLTPQRRPASERLLDEHKARARELGARVTDAERVLDALFAQRQADAAAMDAAMRVIGERHAGASRIALGTFLKGDGS